MRIDDQILKLENLRFYAYHGAKPQESVVGAWYSVTLNLRLDPTNVLTSDDLSDTLNYAEAARIVKEQMAIRSNLIEHVAGRIAEALLRGLPELNSLSVTIVKENPPVCAPCASASFTLSVLR